MASTAASVLICQKKYSALGGSHVGSLIVLLFRCDFRKVQELGKRSLQVRRYSLSGDSVFLGDNNDQQSVKVVWGLCKSAVEQLKLW